VPSNPDEGAANIWLARRRVPTAYVAINNVSETESDVVLSCCGQSYGQGPFVYPKSALYRNAWGYAYVKVPEAPSQNGYFGPIINVQMVSIEGLPANTPIEMVALRYENTEVGWTEANFSIRVSGSNEVFVNLPPVSGDNANEAGYAKKDPGFTGGTGGSNYKIWPTLLQRGPSTEGGINTVALPIVQGGKITGAHILVPGTMAVANKTYFVVEPNALFGRYAVGVVTDVTGTGAAVIRFGDPGALLSTAIGTAPLPNPIQARVKIANTESNIIFYPALNDYGEVVQWQRETGPALADPTIKVAQISAVLNGTNSGGALVTQAHVYGSNTWGIRLGVAAMLNGCEAEGARGANILLDGGFNGSIDDCWLYDAGGSYKGSGVPTGTSAAIGIQVGGFATPGNWRISGHAERLTHGAIVLRGSAQGIVAQLQISDYFGRPYDPNLETIAGNDYDFSVFKLSTTAATAWLVPRKMTVVEC